MKDWVDHSTQRGLSEGEREQSKSIREDKSRISITSIPKNTGVIGTGSEAILSAAAAASDSG